MKYRIDSHKLIFHPEIVAKWLNGETIYPVSVEISPSGGCNCRCRFCAQSYLGYKNRYIDSDILTTRLIEMYANGTKSIVLAGEGEPLLHKRVTEIINSAAKIGLNIAISTNGILLSDDISKSVLKHLSWIRISLNATNNGMYRSVHGVSGNLFDKVLDNIKSAININDCNVKKTTIGVQYVLFNENSDYCEIVRLAKELRNMGADYFSIKPYSEHPESRKDFSAMDYSTESFLAFKQELSNLGTKKFAIILRENAFEQLSGERTYRKCLATPFWSYINSDLDVWSCMSTIGFDDYKFGNLRDNSYRQILDSEACKAVIQKLLNADISECRKACRLDSMNCYLNELKQGVLHQNFI